MDSKSWFNIDFLCTAGGIERTKNAVDGVIVIIMKYRYFCASASAMSGRSIKYMG